MIRMIIVIMVINTMIDSKETIWEKKPGGFEALARLLSPLLLCSPWVKTLLFLEGGEEIIMRPRMREGVEIILWNNLMLHHPKHSHQGTVSFQNLQTFVQSRFGFPGFEAQTKKGKSQPLSFIWRPTWTRSLPVSATTSLPRASRIFNQIDDQNHRKYHHFQIPNQWVRKVGPVSCPLCKCSQWRRIRETPRRWLIAWNFSWLQWWWCDC